MRQIGYCCNIGTIKHVNNYHHFQKGGEHRAPPVARSIAIHNIREAVLLILVSSNSSPSVKECNGL